MKKILIIEDEQSIRETISAILKFHELHPLEARDGRDGLFMALANKPDLILCDIMMPVMDGYKVLQILRNNSDLVHIPFIFLTAKTEKEDLREGMNLGADDYIFKPFSTAELVKAIKARLSKSEKQKEDFQNKINKIIKELNESSAHDFNTSLNGIIGLSELLKQHIDHYPKERISGFLQSINEAGRKLKKVLDNLLFYKQLMQFEANEQIKTSFLMGEYTPFEEIAGKYLSEIATDFERSSELRLSLEEKRIKISRQAFQKITEEIVTNAFKFSNPGTLVDVKGYVENGRYRLDVTNEGLGFSEENIGRIAPFRKFDISVFAQDGNGLGLYISKTLLQMLGYEFIIQSERCKSTTVLLYFDLA